MWIGLQQLEKLYRAGNSPRRNKTSGSFQIYEKTPGSSKSDFSPSSGLSGLFNLTLDEFEEPSSSMTSHEPPSTSEESSKPKRRRLEFPEDVRSPVKHSYYIHDTTGLINKDKYEEFIKIFSDAIEGEGINIKTTFAVPKQAKMFLFDTNILIPQYPKKEIYFEFDDIYYQGTLISNEEIMEYDIINLYDVSKSFSIKLQNLENNSKLVFFTNKSSPF